jgi:hypothetical protein
VLAHYGVLARSWPRPCAVAVRDCQLGGLVARLRVQPGAQVQRIDDVVVLDVVAVGQLER